LTRTKGNQTAAAKLLGTTRRILDYKIHKYRIDREQFKCAG
jgi:Nif-specific regulatory protein